MKNAIKKNLIAGLLVTVPAALTYIVLSFVITRVDRAMEPVIEKLFGFEGFRIMEQYHIPGMGFLLILLFIIFVGLFATNFLGRKVVETGEKILRRIPFVRVIYTSIKKVVDTLSKAETLTFQKMVLVTYPRPPLKALGIVCCDTKGEIVDRTRDNLANIFVPTSPNPTTGFLLMLPEEDLIPLDMSVEDGLKMIISFGVVNPDIQKRDVESASNIEKK